MNARPYFDEATIAAIITPPHAISSVGIVRISGPEALAAALDVCSLPGGNARKITPNYLYRCKVRDHAGQQIDDGMFVFMRAPRSFTGEDVVEIQMHGNPMILNRAVGAIVRTGRVRPAERGEFSFRAFRNGKIDLSQAEGILDLINSRTPIDADLALAALEGKTKNQLAELKSRLLALLAEVEIDIDFSDQDLSVLDYGRWTAELQSWAEEVVRARKRFELAKPLRDGVRVALVGAPNSGKSTLFNALLGDDRSIVSAVAGTTRDVVRESFVFGGVFFRLSDTAGLRVTKDEVEAKGIERSLGEIRGAHLVLLVLDGAAPEQLSADYLIARKNEIHSANPGVQILAILNKADLVAGLDVLSKKSPDVLFVSAKTGSGLDVLSERVRDAFLVIEPDSGLEIGRERHFELLGRAIVCVEEAARLVESGDARPDLLSSSLRGAMMHLGEITGEVTSDDVLNFIFSEFCIGK